MQHDAPIPPLIRVLDEHLDASLDRLDKALTPVWESQIQMGRTIITLASGALVLSISVVQVFAEKVQHPGGVWVLVVSWLSLGVTVLAGALRQSWVGAARALRARVEGQRALLRRKVGDLSVTDEQFGDKWDAILNEAMTTANELPQKAIKVHDGLNHVMFWSFAAGIGGLIYFAIRNLPF